MNTSSHTLLLADDDIDDCLFFKEALEELPFQAALTTVNDGVELMEYLNTDSNQKPEVIFLDLNMPRKTGFDCLTEIKLSESLKHLPVFIISTSMNIDVVDSLYEKGAYFYIQKPGCFFQLKTIISKALTILAENNYQTPSRDQFILHA
ncbi:MULTISPECIES: response regulator [unclassified Flavobacterium]|uniref:response regulator n=1 Tax=unclassified Flavobacterium TaxID=196869 RepID=UPI003F939F2B